MNIHYWTSNESISSLRFSCGHDLDALWGVATLYEQYMLGDNELLFKNDGRSFDKCYVGLFPQQNLSNFLESV